MLRLAVALCTIGACACSESDAIQQPDTRDAAGGASSDATAGQGGALGSSGAAGTGATSGGSIGSGGAIGSGGSSGSGGSTGGGGSSGSGGSTGGGGSLGRDGGGAQGGSGGASGIDGAAGSGGRRQCPEARPGSACAPDGAPAGGTCRNTGGQTCLCQASTPAFWTCFGDCPPGTRSGARCEFDACQNDLDETCFCAPGSGVFRCRVLP